MRLRAYPTALAAIAIAIALAACAPLGGDGDEPAIPESSLPALVLQPEDLPARFSRFDEGALAIADAPTGDRADPQRFDRVGGWKARYRRAGSARTRGPLVVESRADLFESSGGAGRELDAHREELELQLRHPSTARLLEVDELGEEAFALVPGANDVEDAVVSFTVVWRERNVASSVTANGFEGKLVLDDVLGLARAQQRRVAASAPPE